MRREGEQGIRITKEHKRTPAQAELNICSMLMALMGLLTVTDSATPSPGSQWWGVVVAQAPAPEEWGR